MASTITLTGSKFVAQITGLDAKFGFARSFVGAATLAPKQAKLAELEQELAQL